MRKVYLQTGNIGIRYSADYPGPAVEPDMPVNLLTSLQSKKAERDAEGVTFQCLTQCGGFINIGLPPACCIA